MGDITLFKGEKDNALVWRTEDIMELRTKYRIVGKFIGSHAKMARQNQVLSRPMLLTPYEVSLLLEKGFAHLCEQVNTVDQEGMAKHQQSYSEFHKKSFDEQKKLAHDQKQSDILSRSDEIVAGVMKKRGLTRPYTAEEATEVLDGILSEIQPIKEQHMLVQQPIESALSCITVEAAWTFPQTETERLKYLVYRDLWQQQFFLTCGAKFGGDFLVYPGDPELYHAKYIAVCQLDSQMQPTDVVQIARLASNVKKTALICKADLATGKVLYAKLDYNPG